MPEGTHDLKPIDGLLLDRLAEGRNAPSNLADHDDLNVSRQWVSQRLKRLQSAGYVRNVGRGVYELVDDPRATDAERPASAAAATVEGDDRGSDRDALRNALDALDRAVDELPDDVPGGAAVADARAYLHGAIGDE